MGVFGTSQFWGKGGCRGSAMVLFERAKVVSYRLNTVTIALSHSAAICHRISPTLKSTGWITLGQTVGKRSRPT